MAKAVSLRMVNFMIVAMVSVLLLFVLWCFMQRLPLLIKWFDLAGFGFDFDACLLYVGKGHGSLIQQASTWSLICGRAMKERSKCCVDVF
jgi:hypothetical protein